MNLKSWQARFPHGSGQRVLRVLATQPATTCSKFTIETSCEICPKLTIKTPERHQWRRSGVFLVNFEHISHLILVFLLLTLSR